MSWTLITNPVNGPRGDKLWTGLTDEQADGLRCVVCGQNDQKEALIPIGWSAISEVFCHLSCEHDVESRRALCDVCHGPLSSTWVTRTSPKGHAYRLHKKCAPRYDSAPDRRHFSSTLNGQNGGRPPIRRQAKEYIGQLIIRMFETNHPDLSDMCYGAADRELQAEIRQVAEALKSGARV